MKGDETAPREMLEDMLVELYHEDKAGHKFYCLACHGKFVTRDEVIEHLYSDHSILVRRHTCSTCSDENAPSSEANFVQSSEEMALHLPPVAWIVCESREVAIEVKEELSKLPVNHFLRCFSPFTSENGDECLAVENYDKDFYPVSGHLRETAMKHIIDMAADLESKGKLHGNFDENTLVEVGRLPKLYCVPKLDKALKEGIEVQQKQLGNLMDHIVGRAVLQDSTYKNFKANLLKSTTLVDLQSMHFHPCVTSPAMLPFYYVNCHMILERTSKLDHKNKMNRFLGDRLGEFKWTSKVVNHGTNKLVEPYKGRTDGKDIIEYHDTPFEFHTYVWDLMRHVNNKNELVESLQEIHAEVVKLFPDYVQKMFEYMHSMGLNAHLGREDNALPIFGQAKTIITKEESFNIANLTATCKMISYMLARFYPLCEKVEAAKKVEAVAEELEKSIEGLKTLKEKYVKCALFRVKKWKKLSNKDRVLLTSVRFVIGALWLVSNVIKDLETSDCIMKALESTLTDCEHFYEDADKTEIPQLNKLAADQWPVKLSLKKLVGENFITKNSVRLSLVEDIKNLCTKLVGMLDA